jgi:pyruvate dehydrogenase E2 component (dihydrolipoamide acetyltransferase)
MEEGTILRWMKSVGDEVARGEELVEIETDKANMVYEADTAGTMIEIVAGEGDTVGIGEVIARLGDPGEVPSGNGAGAAEPAVAEAPAAAAPAGAEVGRPQASPTGAATSGAGGVEVPPAPVRAGGDGRVKASPLARRLARERGLDLSALSGSGPGGRIVKADVERAGTAVTAPAAPAPAAAPAGAMEAPETARGAVESVELTRLQQTVARRMAESKATAPHFYLRTTIDMSRAVQARSEIKSTTPEGEPVPSVNDLIVKACAIALGEFPRANGAYRDGRVELYGRINVGVAVAGQDALVVPTIFDADRKGLRRIAAESRDLAARVREGSITPPELSGGTFTVSNLGMFGITSFDAVINPPQAGILAVGAIEERPIVREGEMASAHLMEVSLACDHRILYGADGARFLARIRQLLEEPVGLAL